LSRRRDENDGRCYGEGRAGLPGWNGHTGGHLSCAVAARKLDDRATRRGRPTESDRARDGTQAAHYARGIQSQRGDGWKRYWRDGEADGGAALETARRACDDDGERARRRGAARAECQRASRGGRIGAKQSGDTARKTRRRQVDTTAEAILWSDGNRASAAGSLHDAEAAWRCGESVVGRWSHRKCGGLGCTPIGYGDYDLSGGSHCRSRDGEGCRRRSSGNGHTGRDCGRVRVAARQGERGAAVGGGTA
jgi:hypothetical protein